MTKFISPLYFVVVTHFHESGLEGNMNYKSVTEFT